MQYVTTGGEGGGNLSLTGSTTQQQLDERFLPDMGLFSLAVSDSGDSGSWGATGVDVHFFPSWKGHERKNCDCNEVKLVQFADERASGSKWNPIIPYDEGWHLDNAGAATNYLNGKAPFFKNQTKWVAGVLPDYAHSWDGPSPNVDPHYYPFLSWISLSFQVYAVCTKGNDAGMSFGKLDFVLMFNLPNYSEANWWASVTVSEADGFVHSANYIMGSQAGKAVDWTGIKPLP